MVHKSRFWTNGVGCILMIFYAEKKPAFTDLLKTLIDSIIPLIHFIESKYHTPKGMWLAIPTGVDISNQHSLKAGLTAGIVVRPHSGQMPSLLPQQYLEILQGRRGFGTLDRYSLRSGCQTLRYTIPCPHCKN